MVAGDSVWNIETDENGKRIAINLRKECMQQLYLPFLTHRWMAVAAKARTLVATCDLRHCC